MLGALEALPGCLLARMSGSGATCFAILADVDEAVAGAHMIGAEHPDWVGGGDEDHAGTSDMNRLDESRDFIPVGIAVLTVSDTRTRDDDRSGDILAARVEEAGHRLAARAIVADEVEGLRSRVREWVADPAIDVIVTTGGTGFTGRDVTPEALEPLFAKHMDGFSQVFHALSFDKIGTSTIQSRATAGVIESTFVFCVPGSPGACRDAWDGILRPQLDYRHRPCNFVEIMPRLDEHLKRGKARG